MAEYPDPQASDEQVPGEKGGSPAPDHGSSFADEELPPVEPPSAGFIMQLFLVPALIVLAIVGMWALFGKMVSGEQDWQELVAELRSGNERRHWRAALSLAQMLQADQQGGSDSGRLTRNPDIANELSALLQEKLQSPSSGEEARKQRVFLTRTLGLLDVPDAVLPVLQEAMQPRHDREIRKSALVSVAKIADRARRHGGMKRPELVHAVIRTSADGDPLLRQVGAYTLGLIPGEPSRRRLKVLLEDPDRKTRINAAIGLARQDSAAGLSVFRKVLVEAADADPLPLRPAGDSETERREARNARLEEFLGAKNVVKAVGVLHDELTPNEQREMRRLLQPIAEAHPEPRVRLEARRVLPKLQPASDD